jgi:hypothetical protein
MPKGIRCPYIIQQVRGLFLEKNQKILLAMMEIAKLR